MEEKIMLCESCRKNQATVHSVVIKNGQKSEQYLCSDCARSIGFKLEPFPALLGMLTGRENDAVSPLKCSCGTDMVKFFESGLLGCPECYRVHRNELIGIIKKAQGGRIQHTGRSPSKFEPKAPDKLISLKNQLAEAIKNEQYEHAAQLRDQIKAMSEKRDGTNADK
jgi:protein arginine kinase activator